MSRTLKIYLLGLTTLVSLVMILLCYSNGIQGNDFWWHIKVGEWICKYKDIPQTDIFSWYGIENGLEWDAHEWLSQVIYWKMYCWGGEKLIYLFCLMAAIGMTILLIRKSLPHFFDNIVVSVIFFIAFSFVASMFFYGRPHVFSFFLLYAELECIYAYKERKKDYMLCFIPVIAILWSNMHGGSALLSYILCIVVLISGLVQGEWGRIYSVRLEQKRMVKLLLITLLTIGAIMVNPAGGRMLLYPYWNMNNDLMMIISEWLSPDIKRMDHLLLFFVPIFVSVYGMLFSHKRIQLTDLALMLMFLFLFLNSKRFVVLFFVAAPFFAFPYNMECKIKEIKGKAEHGAICGLMGLLSIVTLGCTSQIKKCLDGDVIISQVLEENDINWVAKQTPKRLFNDFNFGESLIFHDIPVFFDSRVDLYVKDGSFADGVSLMTMTQYNNDAVTSHMDVEEIINKYGFDAFLIMPERPLYVYLKSHSEKYDLLYESEDMAYFIKVE